MKAQLVKNLFFLLTVMVSTCASLFFSNCTKNTPRAEVLDSKTIDSMKLNAISLLKEFPQAATIDTSRFLSNEGKAIIKRLRDLLEQESKLPARSSKQEIDAIQNEYSWAAMSMVIFIRNTGGTDPKSKCRQACEGIYGDCFEKNGCKFGFGCSSCDRALGVCLTSCLLKGQFTGVGTVLF